MSLNNWKDVARSMGVSEQTAMMLKLLERLFTEVAPENRDVFLRVLKEFPGTEAWVESIESGEANEDTLLGSYDLKELGHGVNGKLKFRVTACGNTHEQHENGETHNHGCHFGSHDAHVLILEVKKGIASAKAVESAAGIRFTFPKNITVQQAVDFMNQWATQHLPSSEAIVQYEGEYAEMIFSTTEFEHQILLQEAGALAETIKAPKE